MRRRILLCLALLGCASTPSGDGTAAISGPSFNLEGCYLSDPTACARINNAISYLEEHENWECMRVGNNARMLYSSTNVDIGFFDGDGSPSYDAYVPMSPSVHCSSGWCADESRIYVNRISTNAGFGGALSGHEVTHVLGEENHDHTTSYAQWIETICSPPS